MGRRMMEIVVAAALISVMTGCTGEQTKGNISTGTGIGIGQTSNTPEEVSTSSPIASNAPSTLLPPSTPSSTVKPPLPANSPKPSIKPTPTSFAKEADAKKAIESRAKETIQVLKQHDMKMLSELIHPKKGVQFSPYSHINVTSDVQVQGSGLAALWANTSTTYWGTYDGSGDPIDLTFPDYWDKFVYNQDFAIAPQISFNLILGKGNMINNVFSVYPTTSNITVEYHFPGIDPQYQGMDWTSLRLVYENSGTQWYLVAIVHDQHTM